MKMEHLFLLLLLKLLPNRISQVKKIDKEGYSAIQVSSGSIKQSKINKSFVWSFCINKNKTWQKTSVSSELSESNVMNSRPAWNSRLIFSKKGKS